MIPWTQVLYGGSLDLIQERIAQGLTQAELDDALRKTAYRGKEACLRALLAAGADPNAQDAAHMNALRLALSGPSIKCVKALIPLTDLSRRGPGGVTACMMAAKSKSPAALDALISPHEAAQTCDQGWTPLFYASYYGATAALARLLPLSDVSARDAQGRTALMAAAERGSMAALQMLLPLIDPSLVDHGGRDAAALAKAEGSMKAARFLKAFATARDEMATLDQAALPACPRKPKVHF